MTKIESKLTEIVQEHKSYADKVTGVAGTFTLPQLTKAEDFKSIVADARNEELVLQREREK